jgi:hypothetical protein
VDSLVFYENLSKLFAKEIVATTFLLRLQYVVVWVLDSIIYLGLDLWFVRFSQVDHRLEKVLDIVKVVCLG